MKPCERSSWPWPPKIRRGELSPWPIERPEEADALRRGVGLDPLEENTRRIRAETARSGEGCPPDLRARREAMERWARSVGWLQVF